MFDGFDHGAVVGLNRAVLLQTHRLQSLVLLYHRFLKAKGQSEVGCAVLHGRQHLEQRQSEHLFHKAVEQTVVSNLLVYQVQGTARKFLNYLLTLEHLQHSSDQQVQERTHQHFGFVLGSLNVNHRAVDQLHQFSE